MKDTFSGSPPVLNLTVPRVVRAKPAAPAEATERTPGPERRVERDFGGA